MNLWIVNHPYRYRNWRKFEAKVLENFDWNQGHIWAEWVDNAQGVAALPIKPPAHWNVDPLIVGKKMYFDYCRKSTGARNDIARNSLDVGDLILFGSVWKDAIIIDTVFPIGEHQQWPLVGVPPWNDIEEVASRVHFHNAAHERQHPEVHQSKMVRARSYRARNYEINPDAPMFAWVPFTAQVTHETQPFQLAPEGRAYAILRGIYDDRRDKVLQRKMKGSFSVRQLSFDKGKSLFDALRQEATEQGFHIAVAVRLLGDSDQK